MAGQITKIYQVCPRCKGEKALTINDQPYDEGPPETIECHECEGSGRLLWGGFETGQ